MICWPSYLVGALTLSLIIFDLIQQDWSSLPIHSLGGILLTLVLYGLCYLIGPNITGGILLVPGLAILFFFLGAFFTGYTIRKTGCCLKCGDQSCSQPTPSTGSSTESCKAEPTVNITQASPSSCLSAVLKATPLT